MPKIALSTVKSLINFLTTEGISRELMLSKAALTEQQLNQSNDLIDTSTYELLYQLAEENLPFKNIGFEFGKLIEPDRWGILGYIAFTSPTLKAALNNQRKYQTIVGNVGTPLQEFEQSNLILKWLPAYQCSFQTVEEIITCWAAVAKKLTNYKVHPIKVYFSHSCQTNIAQYQKFFNCSVQFEHDFNGIEIDVSLLETPLNKYDPEMNDMFCQYAERVINNLVETLPVEVISQFITNQLPSGVPEIEDAAQNLQMSVRTLQRKLSEHQLTFSGLIDAIRKNLAISYLLNTDTKVVYISQMLGFSEQSAFQRAFKRWTEQTPKQFRDSC
jgi:AraC-like DNA-binding protein